MMNTPILVVALFAGSLLLSGCASPTSNSSVDQTTQPIVTSEAPVNTDPRKGWVELEPAPMPHGLVHISIKCQGTTLMYATQDGNMGSASFAVSANASECVG